MRFVVAWELLGNRPLLNVFEDNLFSGWAIAWHMVVLSIEILVVDILFMNSIFLSPPLSRSTSQSQLSIACVSGLLYRIIGKSGSIQPAKRSYDVILRCQHDFM